MNLDLNHFMIAISSYSLNVCPVLSMHRTARNVILISLYVEKHVEKQAQKTTS